MTTKRITQIHVVAELPQINQADYPPLPSLQNLELQVSRADYAEQVVAASIIGACISAQEWKPVDFQSLIYHLRRYSLWILDTEAVSKAFWKMAGEQMFFVVQLNTMIQPGGLHVVPTSAVNRFIMQFLNEAEE